MAIQVPEPEPNKSEVEQSAGPHNHQVILISSDEDNEEEQDQPQLNGYEPLPVVDQHESSDEEDEAEPVPLENKVQQKAFDIDQDLVIQMMRNVKLDMTSIPPWAKEISDTAWSEVVKQTVGKESEVANGDSNAPGCSSQSEPEPPNSTNPS